MKVSEILALALVVFTAMPLAAAGAAVNDDEIILQSEASLDDGAMIEARGAAAENNVVSSQSLSATATGNTVNVTGDLVTGNINIGDNVGGFGSYVNNTGNNTAINSAMNVTVQMMPVAP